MTKAVPIDQAVENSTVAVTISAASVDTDEQARDDHLRSPDFFNAAEFPEITFASTTIERTSDKTGKITGDLTLLGGPAHASHAQPPDRTV